MTVGVLPFAPTVTLPTTTTGAPTSTRLIHPSAKHARRVAAIRPNTHANGVRDHATQPRRRHSRAKKFSMGGLRSDMMRLASIRVAGRTALLHRADSPDSGGCGKFPGACGDLGPGTLARCRAW